MPSWGSDLRKRSKARWMGRSREAWKEVGLTPSTLAFCPPSARCPATPTLPPNHTLNRVGRTRGRGLCDGMSTQSVLELREGSCKRSRRTHGGNVSMTNLLLKNCACFRCAKESARSVPFPSYGMTSMATLPDTNHVFADAAGVLLVGWTLNACRRFRANPPIDEFPWWAFGGNRGKFTGACSPSS